MRAAIYARVSSDRQREARSIEAQEPAARTLAERFGWAVVAVYVDDGVSAKSGNIAARTGLLAALTAAAAGAFDVLIVYDVDRLTRADSQRERGYILGSLQEAGVKIASVAKGSVIDLDTDEGDLLAGLDGYFAASWLRKHRARVSAGKERAIAANRKPAGPTPYGLRYARATGAWSIEEGEAAIVREVFARVADGEDCRSISDNLERRGVKRARAAHWSHDRVYNIVKNPAYRGEWTIDKKRARVLTVPVIVDSALWQAAQTRLRSRGRRGGIRGRHFYLLEGVVTCSSCRAPLWIHHTKHAHRGVDVTYYNCANRRRERYGLERCVGVPMMRTEDLDARTWAGVVERLSQREWLERALAEQFAISGGEAKDWTTDIRAAENQLRELARTDEAILERFTEGRIAAEVMDAHLERSRGRRHMLDRQLASARRAAAAAAGQQELVEGVLANVATLRARVEDAGQADRRDLVCALLAASGRKLELQPDGSLTGMMVIGTPVVSISGAATSCA